MNYSEDGYAAMLLTMALSPDKTEFARPCGAQEFWTLEADVLASRYGRLGKLLEADVSGLMIYLHLTEAQALRIYTLLNRDVQIMYMLERFEHSGIEVVTFCDDAYPQRVRRKLGKSAPAFFFRYGDMARFRRPTLAILGVQGVRTSQEMRASVERLVGLAAARNYTILTGGELGVSGVASNMARQLGGRLVEVLGGGLMEYAGRPENRDALALSLEHPEALYTADHAALRNRLLFSMADAAFIFNTDGQRGEAEMLQKKACDWVYAWSDWPGNRPLIAKGAIPFKDFNESEFDAASAHWSSSDSEQMSIFDLI